MRRADSIESIGALFTTSCSSANGEEEDAIADYETILNQNRQNNVLPSLQNNIMHDENNNNEGKSRFDIFADSAFRFRCLSTSQKFYALFVFFPAMLSLYYAALILLPPEASEKAPLLLLWCKGELIIDNEGQGHASLCPRESICSEGWIQIFLLAVSRLTAFASYIFMAYTFMSKMHSTAHALSTTYIFSFIPFTRLHQMHKFVSRCYGVLALLHSVCHILRWILRRDIVALLIKSQVGLSGLSALFGMILSVWTMTAWAKHRLELTFEQRMRLHKVGFLLLFAALCFHTPRCRLLSCIFSGLWLADYLYGYLFKTYRLDLVEFTPLPDESGVQMLWRNPPGFNANSGEYVQIKLPWLSEGGQEWHPFSIYLKERTERGLDFVHSKHGLARQESVQITMDGMNIDTLTTALILIEYQNEFACKGGKLHDSVKEVMRDTNMLNNTVDLVEYARTVGVRVIHVPIVFDGTGLDNPNMKHGILKACHAGGLFVQGTWNAEIIDCLRPKINDVIIQDKKGLDSFFGTDLQEQLKKRGIETVILGGFLTNCCVESTMRTAYEKGYNVITLEDGSACHSVEEQRVSITKSCKMFSTPMKCSEVKELLRGDVPERLQDQFSTTSTSTLTDIEAPGPVLPWTDLKSFVQNRMSAETCVTRNSSRVMKEARKQMRSQNDTTQVFMRIAGTWTREVYNEVWRHQQLRHCWVKGPYISPFSVVSSFSHLVLVASGIGITPALGVMGQYIGKSRTKILVWSTRCVHLLRFFIPLIKDTAMFAIIYYTGEEKLSNAELSELCNNETTNVFIQQSRPENIAYGTVSTIITTVASMNRTYSYRSMQGIPMKTRKQWCILYCGGSKKIRDMFSDFSKDTKVSFEYELFDW